MGKPTLWRSMMTRWLLRGIVRYLRSRYGDGHRAAGDVRLDSVKRVASAVDEDAMSVCFVHRYLATI